MYNMATKSTLLGLLVLLTLSCQRACAAPAKEDVKTSATDFWRVCYYTNWSQYRLGQATFMPEDIDTTLCNRLLYAFADMDGNQLTFFEPNDEDLYGRFNRLKIGNPELKTLLAVGGWTFGTSKFSLMFSSQENRTEFIDSCIEWARLYNFDGIDLDFEYPGNRGSPPEDKFRFTLLVEEMNNAFALEAIQTGREKLLLTLGVAAGRTVIDTAYEVAELAAAADKIILMSYDMNGGWTNDTGIHAPLYADTNGLPSDLEISVEWSAEYFVQLGCPRDKLVIGMPMYGRGWTLINPLIDNGIGAQCKGRSDAFIHTREPGIATYYELCTNIFPGGTHVWEQEQMVPYVYNGDQWFGYDNETSLSNKVDWLVANGFEGWMVWSLDFDDFKGEFCGGRTYPLLRALNEALWPYSTTSTTSAVTPAPSSTTTDGSPIVLPPPDMTFCQEKMDGHYPDPETCVRYYRCSDQDTFPMSCPDGLIYDPSTVSCNWPEQVDLTYRCENCEPRYCVVDYGKHRPVHIDHDVPAKQ